MIQLFSYKDTNILKYETEAREKRWERGAIEEGEGNRKTALESTVGPYLMGYTSPSLLSLFQISIHFQLL